MLIPSPRFWSIPPTISISPRNLAASELYDAVWNSEYLFNQECKAAKWVAMSLGPHADFLVAVPADHDGSLSSRFSATTTSTDNTLIHPHGRSMVNWTFSLKKF